VAGPPDHRLGLSTVLSAIDLGYRIILVQDALCTDEAMMPSLTSTASDSTYRSASQASNKSSAYGSPDKKATTRSLSTSDARFTLRRSLAFDDKPMMRKLGPG
jgi:hypothetical protein